MSCSAYSGYSVVLVGLYEDFSAAFEFSQVALRLSERFSSTRHLGTMLFRHGNFVNGWRRPLATSIPILEQCFLASIEVGNFVYATYVACYKGWMVFERGEQLSTVAQELRKYIPFAQQSRIGWALDMIRLQGLFVAGLEDATGSWPTPKRPKRPKPNRSRPC